jgi:hypothetical protein
MRHVAYRRIPRPAFSHRQNLRAQAPQDEVPLLQQVGLVNTERRHPKPRLLPGRIAANGSGAPHPCDILDISGVNARLRAADPAQLPNEFVLLLSADGRVHRRCKVIWRSSDEIGVRFMPGPGPRTKPAGAGSRVVTLDT